MIGMSRTTGARIDGDAHLIQSIADILTTPIGTRVMRRDYGSLLFDLLDRPFNAATRLLCVMAVAMAVARWEPRVDVRQVLLEGDPARGQLSIIILGQRTDAPEATALTRLSVPILGQTTGL